MNDSNSSYWNKPKSDFMEYVKREILKPQGEYKRYTRSVDLLIEYAEANGYNEYSPEVGMAFYESEKAHGYKGYSTLGYRRAAIRHLNEFLYGNSFWQRKPRNVFRYQTSKVPLQCPKQFSEVLERFLQTIHKEGLKDITVNQYRVACTKMLLDFEEQGVAGWEDIDAKNLTSAYMRSTNKYHFVSYSRRLFQYLLDAGVVTTNYTGILPSMSKHKAIPSVYSESEINQLLESVETFTPQGKRDYAILLIAVRLGLRQSDIRLLRFENVDFENASVSLIQFKTLVPLELSLPDEVAKALHDYIDNGREESDEPYIFLNGYGGALTQHAVSHITSRHFKKAKINVGDRRHSTHALRMTFASQLIAENVPYEVVRVLLGHVNRDSTRHYVEFSIEGLRSCALEVPAPSGLFAQYMAEEA